MITQDRVLPMTPLIWQAAGGTHAITLASIANAAARCGVVADLAIRDRQGADKIPEKIHVQFTINMNVAPAAGATVELWWAPSTDGVVFRGGATGTDAAYVGSALGTVAESKIQMMLIGALVLTPDADGTIQIQDFTFSPPTRYGCPVVVNLGGQALEGDDDSHEIRFTALMKEAA